MWTHVYSVDPSAIFHDRFYQTVVDFPGSIEGYQSPANCGLVGNDNDFETFRMKPLQGINRPG